MAQDPNFGQVPNGGGAAVRAGFNASSIADATNHAGINAPPVTYPNMMWDDTTNLLLKRRDPGNSFWEILENYGASSSPGIDDDAVAGYVIGARWLDATNNKVYLCLSSAVGDAIWLDLSDGGGGDVTNPMTSPLDVGGQAIVSGVDVDISLDPGGSGDVVIGNFRLDGDQAVGAGSDRYALIYDHLAGNVALRPQSGSGGGNSVEVEGSASMPASIPAGGSVEIVVTGMTGITSADWVISLVHVPSTNAEIDRYAVITANDQATVTLTNIGTTAITGLSGNITVRARTLAGTPGLSGTAAMPASIPAGGSVEVTVTVTGATTNYAVPFVHVPSTNAEIERYGVVTAADQVTVVLTNTSTTEISGLTGNITVKAESI